MFEIGERVKWYVGQSRALCKGLYYTQIDEEYSDVRCYENNNRPWNCHQEVRTIDLEKDGN